jgi:hypothetical protein
MKEQTITVRAENDVALRKMLKIIMPRYAEYTVLGDGRGYLIEQKDMQDYYEI